MINLDHSVDRLVEITFAARVTDYEIEEFASRMRRRLASIAEVIFLVDFSGLQVLGSEQAQRITAIMREDNDNVARSAFLLPRSAVSALQTERMIRSAGNPRRRAFLAVGELFAWLDPILNPRELARAHAFFEAEAARSEAAR